MFNNELTKTQNSLEIVSYLIIKIYGMEITTNIISYIL